MYPDSTPNFSGKVCVDCQQHKPLSEFYKSLRCKDGFRNSCKLCFQERGRKRFQDNPYTEKKCGRCKSVKPLEEFMKDRTTPDGHSQYCRDCSSVVHRANYERNSEKSKQTDREYRQRPEIRIAHKLRTKQYKQQKRSNGGRFTKTQFKELCQRYGNVCLCCGFEGPLHADHVIPVSLGGTNSIENRQPLCVSCNASKGTKSTDYRPDCTTSSELSTAT